LVKPGPLPLLSSPLPTPYRHNLYSRVNQHFAGELPIELENANLGSQVQWVVRPQSADLHDNRGYAGRVLGEGLKVGEEVLVLPSGSKSKVKSIEFDSQELPEAQNGSSVIIHLEDEIDISRGDFIVSANHPAKTDKSFEANISWFENKELDLGQIYLLQTHSKVSKIKIPEILYKYDVHTQEQLYEQAIGLNDIGRVLIKSADEIVYDQQKDFPENSRAIIIDPRTNITVAAAIIQ